MATCGQCENADTRGNGVLWEQKGAQEGYARRSQTIAPGWNLNTGGRLEGVNHVLSFILLHQETVESPGVNRSSDMVTIIHQQGGVAGKEVTYVIWQSETLETVAIEGEIGERSRILKHWEQRFESIGVQFIVMHIHA